MSTSDKSDAPRDLELSSASSSSTSTSASGSFISSTPEEEKGRRVRPETTGPGGGPTDLTSVPPYDDDCQIEMPGKDMYIQEPPKDTSGGHGHSFPENEAMPEADIQLIVYADVVTTSGVDRPRLGFTRLKWIPKEGLPEPAYYRVYRDDVAIAETSHKSVEDMRVLREEKYSYRVYAVDASDQEYASSFTIHYTTPDTSELYKSFKTVAFMPVRFPDHEEPNKTMEEYQEMLSRLMDYIKEASYQKQEISITILPYYTLNHGKSHYCTQMQDGYGKSCDGQAIREEAIAAHGYEDGDFDAWLTSVSGKLETGGGADRYCIFGDHKLDTGGIIHEFGHLYGLWHANAWTCPDPDIYGPSVENPNEGECKMVMYHDYFTGMGTANHRHYHSLHKHMMGWLNNDQIQVVTEPGNYEIAALETGGNAPVMLKIPLKGVSEKIFYFLEYVKPIGFDSDPIPHINAFTLKMTEFSNQALEGVLVRLKFDFKAGGYPAIGTTADTGLIKRVVYEGSDYHDMLRDFKVEFVGYKPGNIVEVKISGDF